MSDQLSGFYFSCDADRSTHDYAVYVQSRDSLTVSVGARYKNAEEESLYQIMMDADDLAIFGQMCIDFAKIMKARQS